jgi:hypothetical protein
MSKMQRSKGQRGEREFFGLLSEQLGTCVRRNVDQARAGGADGIEVPGWSIEVKRHETGFRSEWWKQACEQAGADLWPALAYRASRQPWRVRLPLIAVQPKFVVPWPVPWIECDLSTFAFIVRESIQTPSA